MSRSMLINDVRPLNAAVDRRPVNTRGRYTDIDASDALCTEAFDLSPLTAWPVILHLSGLLLDQESGLASLNKLASGSGSVPSLDASYDAITRKTALSAISALRSQSRRLRSERAASTDDLSTPLPPPPHPPLPFVFVSAAEAGWTFEAPVPFLERYLIAKRAVEAELLTPADAMASAARSALDDSLLLRGVVLRPSLIWTWERPQALLSVLPFYVANALGLPFIDR